MDEEVDPEGDHKDVVLKWDEHIIRKGHKKVQKSWTPVFHEALVMKGEYDENMWARDRLHWLVRYVSILLPQRRTYWEAICHHHPRR